MKNNRGKKRIVFSYIFYTAITVAAIAVIFYSCNKTTYTTAPSLKYGYYPTEVDKYITYSADSIIYNDFDGTIDTFHHEIKDVYASTFMDNQGRLSYNVNRYVRDNASQSWQPNMTYAVTPAAMHIEVLENNLRFIKMVFPITLNFTWDGNAYIDPSTDDNLQYLDGWDYAYTTVDAPDEIGNLSFDSTVTVMEKDDSVSVPAFASRLYSKEEYAKNVGLIYRHFIHWEQQCSDYDQSGNCQALGPKKGVEVIMQIIDHN